MSRNKISTYHVNTLQLDLCPSLLPHLNTPFFFFIFFFFTVHKMGKGDLCKQLLEHNKAQKKATKEENGNSVQ